MSEHTMPEPDCLKFDAGEEWFAGRVLWVWAPSWETPRLAIADSGDDFNWFLSGGPKLEDTAAAYPTHCCDLVRPAPPAVLGRPGNPEYAVQGQDHSDV